MYNSIIIICTTVLVFILIVLNVKFNFNTFKKDLGYRISTIINTYIKEQETKYRIAMVKNEMNPLLYKYNILMSRLKLEIPVFRDLTLFQFKWVIYIISVLVAISVNTMVFRNMIILPFLCIICFIFILCGIFSLTIKNRLQRIIDCINTENILSANISRGFLSDVKTNLQSIPLSVRPAYIQYVNNVEKLNYSTKEAIAILDLDTGKFSTDFLKNVVILETNRTEGFIETFKNITEINIIKKLARNTMDSLIQKISKDFSIAVIISYGSFALELVLCNFLFVFYFKNTIGQIILLIDLMVAAGVYLAVNVLKAKEL